MLYSVQYVGDKQERPYKHDSTASRPLSEVKHALAVLVLRWGTTLESTVLFFYFFYEANRRRSGFWQISRYRATRPSIANRASQE
jgi:hypothetical protein